MWYELEANNPNAQVGQYKMMVYFASPNTQQQAEKLCDKPALISKAIYSPWLDRYQQSFSRILVDSGAFSELNSGIKIDLTEYSEWSSQWKLTADAIAGLDDISGDWRRSVRNYEVCGFPTMHDTDPPELLKDLIPIAQERGKWLGIGLKPPREGKEDFVRWVCDNVPDDIHVHGWALRRYTHIRRIDSVDSTNWWRDGMDVRKKIPWITYGEALDLVMLRYAREERIITDAVSDPQRLMFQ